MLVNIFAREGLFVNGIIGIRRVQDYFQSGPFTLIQNVISYLSDVPFLSFAILLMFILSRRKITLFVFLIYFMFSVYVNILEKLFF